MRGDELVDGSRPRDEDRDARLPPPAGTAHLLPGGCDGARVPCQDCRVQAANVDAQLERIGRDDPEHLAAAQPGLDCAPLGGQIATSITTHALHRAKALPQRFAQARQQQLDADPGFPKDDRLAAGAQERQRGAMGESDRSRADALALVDRRRIEDHDVLLARGRPIPVDDPYWTADQRLRERLRGLPMVAEQHTICGWLP